MKNALVCLMMILACSCRQPDDNSRVDGSAEVVARHEAVLRIMRDAYVRDLEKNAHRMTPVARNELRRLQRDGYAEASARDGDPIFVIPGRGWKIRGPLTVAQVEQESLDQLNKSGRTDIPPGPFGFIGDDWVRLRSNYREGDEFYFFRSDERSWAYLRGGEGYILIRGNEEVGRIVTSMN